MFPTGYYPIGYYPGGYFPPAAPVEAVEVSDDVGTRDLSQFPTGGAIVPSRWTGARLPSRAGRDARDARDLKDIHDILLALSALDPDQ